MARGINRGAQGAIGQARGWRSLTPKWLATRLMSAAAGEAGHSMWRLGQCSQYLDSRGMPA
jgi:hypothetical protein